MRPHCRTGVVVLCLAAAALDAQTYIVDAANGPGTNFTDLATATATVPDGAVLDVRPGSYNSFAIVGKGLSVLFQAGAMVQNLPLPWTASISNTSAAQTVLLRGVVLGRMGWPTEAAIHLAGCQGPVLLEDCFAYARTGPVLVATNCIQVHATRCAFGEYTQTWTGASIDHSEVVLRNCSVAGGFPGLAATSSAVQLVDTSVGGIPIYSIVGPAIQMQGGDVRMVGGTTVSLFNYAFGGSGTARIDPSVSFYGATAPFAPTIQGTIQPMPAVVATDGPLGGNVTIALRGPAGDFGALLGGLPGPPFTFPGLADPSWMLPGSEVVCLTTTLAPAGTGVTYPVPNVPGLRGARFAWQGVSFGTANGLQASNPAITTHW